MTILVLNRNNIFLNQVRKQTFAIITIMLCSILELSETSHPLSALLTLGTWDLVFAKSTRGRDLLLLPPISLCNK